MTYRTFWKLVNFRLLHASWRIQLLDQLGQEAINSGLLSFVIAWSLSSCSWCLITAMQVLFADIVLFCQRIFHHGYPSPHWERYLHFRYCRYRIDHRSFSRCEHPDLWTCTWRTCFGKGIRLAVSDGFKHAYSSIIDSNITTLILGIILYTFGTGPIQGFATTLIVGILTSLFCAIFISRLIFDWMLAKQGYPFLEQCNQRSILRTFTSTSLTREKSITLFR